MTGVVVVCGAMRIFGFTNHRCILLVGCFRLSYIFTLLHPQERQAVLRR